MVKAKNEEKKGSGEIKFRFKVLEKKKAEPKNDVWGESRSECYHLVKELEKKIPDYSYSDPHISQVTDERICAILIETLSKIKAEFFGLIEYLYETRKEAHMNKELVRLRDAVDVFSDEIKARYCKWKDINKNWMMKIIRHDSKLLGKSSHMLMELESLNKEALSSSKLRISKKEAVYAPEEWEEWKSVLEKVEKEIAELVMLFKERESICNLKSISLKKTYQMIRADLRDDFG